MDAAGSNAVHVDTGTGHILRNGLSERDDGRLARAVARTVRAIHRDASVEAMLIVLPYFFGSMILRASRVQENTP